MQPNSSSFSRFIRRRQPRSPEAEVPIDEDTLLREGMRQKRVELARLAYTGLSSGRARADQRRFIQTVTRKKFGLVRNKRRLIPKGLLVSRFRKSPLLDALVPNREEMWVPILRRNPDEGRAVITFRNTSLIDNPIETLATMRRMVEAETCEIGAIINFEDDYCHDIGAFLVLGEMWPSMAPVYHGGKMNAPVQKALKAVGLGHHLQITLKAATNTEDIWAFPLQRRRPRNTTASLNMLLEPQKREMVADGLCDAIDEWLALPKIDQELTIDGRAWLTSLVGELLDNAERHSAPETKDGDWSTAAFVARRVEGGEEIYRCYMAFLSVGATISESLASASPEIQEYLSLYVNRHRQAGLTAESLRTLFALQDGVTRDPAAAAGRRGGVGLQEVLYFVDLLGGTQKPGCDAHVTIISGNTCIQLRQPHMIGHPKTVDGPRVLWCNALNTPQDPPDPSFVYHLPDRVAGTIISMAFTLDPEYLNATLDSDDDYGTDDRPQ
jgi:hypothetical protein